MSEKPLGVLHNPFLPAVLLALFSLGWTGGGLMWPEVGEPVAAVFPPWISRDAAFQQTAASSQEAWGYGRWGTVVIARSDDAGFFDKLHDSGAILVIRVPRSAECINQGV